MSDPGANAWHCVISGKDAKYATKRYPINPPLEVKGIQGVAKATEGGVIEVGNLEIHGPVIEGAPRSVVTPKYLMDGGGN